MCDITCHWLSFSLGGNLTPLLASEGNTILCHAFPGSQKLRPSLVCTAETQWKTLELAPNFVTLQYFPESLLR